MGLFEKIFKFYAANKTADGTFQTLTAYSPVFSSFGGKIYESHLVRLSVHARATHISKLSVQIMGSAKPALQNKLKLQPNEWQTWGQFLYRLSTILDVHNTAFIVPVMNDYLQTTGVFTVLPSRCEIVSYSGEPWLRYEFRTGQFASVEMKYCGILSKFQYQDDFFGENNQALLPTMELINIQNQGIAEGVKSAATYRFMAKINNYLKPEDMVKERKRFTRENLQQGDGGVLLFPSTYSDVQQIKSTPFVVDAEQMKLIQNSVYQYFGTNDKILKNEAYGDDLNAFYDGAVEPFAIQLSDVLTKMLFTERERTSGTYFLTTANRLQYLSNKEKMQLAFGAADRGAFNRDEVRALFGKPPLPNGQGQAYTIRGEYYLLNNDGSVTKKGDDVTSGT